MRPRALLLALVALALAGCGPDPLAAFGDGVPEGRRGVALLRQADALAADSSTAPQARALYQEAADRLIAGLADDDVARPTQAKLWHALGFARLHLGEAAPADSAYADALVRADSLDQRARYALDAGTAALLAGDPARAVDLLRRALLLDPSSAAARRNYEIARRALDQDDRPEPSDFAREVKARADSLVSARQYRAALDVMEEGLAQDSSVAAFADFTQRLGGVVQIEETTSPGDVPTDRVPPSRVDSLP